MEPAPLTPNRVISGNQNLLLEMLPPPRVGRLMHLEALGGHKRCHWEKGDNEPSVTIPSFPPSSSSSQHPVEHDTSSSPLTLDLRLGL
ncbi:hypothetical protein L6164_004690 [Bauhinia variegata]|uniref:Uncharacterized protein n=1 Tax=Bauhinia variegata TaxID=167791 RepID=A0ACB9PNB3_BAUVA|nr:hypothetical protein L6164_004690 [Bauhinia variegata]